MDRLRTLILPVVVTGLFILWTTPVLAQVKAKTINSERQLKQQLANGKYVDGGTFDIQFDVKKRYVVTLERKYAATGKRDAQAFFARLKIPLQGVQWDFYDEMDGERAMVEPINFITKLPYETKNFRVEYDYYDDEVLVVPQIEIDGLKNPLEEMMRVWKAYEKKANEAVAWMKKQGFEGWCKVRFWMQDFWPEGKKIKLLWKEQ